MRYDHEAFLAGWRSGMAIESVLPIHPANGTSITWWRFVGRRGPLFDLGIRVIEEVSQDA